MASNETFCFLGRFTPAVVLQGVDESHPGFNEQIKAPGTICSPGSRGKTGLQRESSADGQRSGAETGLQALLQLPQHYGQPDDSSTNCAQLPSHSQPLVSSRLHRKYGSGTKWSYRPLCGNHCPIKLLKSSSPYQHFISKHCPEVNGIYRRGDVILKRPSRQAGGN